MPLALHTGFYAPSQKRELAEEQVISPITLPKGAVGVTVLFERAGKGVGGQQLVRVNGATSIHEIKLTGRHRGWFKEGDCLVSPIESCSLCLKFHSIELMTCFELYADFLTDCFANEDPTHSLCIIL